MELQLYNNMPGEARLFRDDSSILMTFYPPPMELFSTITISELIKKFGLLRGPWKKTDWGYRCNVKSISPNFK